jgi:hypothetical protein
VLGLLERGQAAGRLRPDLPAELFAQSVVGTLRLALRFAGPAADPASIGAQVADLLLHGMAVGPR